MRAKIINEIDDSLFKPKELKGAIKKIYDAKEQLESIGIKTSKIETFGYDIGYLEFDIFDKTIHHKRIWVSFIDKEIHNKTHKENIEHDKWVFANYNRGDRFETYSWDEMFYYILKSLYVNIDTINTEIGDLNSKMVTLEQKMRRLKKEIKHLEKIKEILNGQ